jgi:hypothetical protein
MRGSGLYNALGRAWVALPSCRAAFALRHLRIARDLGWCDHDYPRWGAHTLDAVTTPPCSAHRLLSWGRSYHGPGSDPSPLIETFITLCGMVWLRGFAGEGLRSVGAASTRPQPRASALSCPPPDIYGPEHRRTPARRFASACTSLVIELQDPLCAEITHLR